MVALKTEVWLWECKRDKQGLSIHVPTLQLTSLTSLLITLRIWTLPTMDIRITYWVCRLSNSCMRNNFSSLNISRNLEDQRSKISRSMLSSRSNCIRSIRGIHSNRWTTIYSNK